jgi:hypothetical protein
MLRFTLLQPAPYLVAVEGVLDPSDLASLGNEISKSSRSPSVIVDFSQTRIPEKSWPELERHLIRWHTRHPGDVWYTGLRSRENWCHAPEPKDALQLIEQPELSWAKVAEWREKRLEELRSKIASLQEALEKPELSAEQQKARSIRRHRQIRSWLDRERSKTDRIESSTQLPLSTTRLEDKIIAALASEGI